MATIVPTPTVSVTAPIIQTMGQSLKLEYSGATVRGVTSNVVIVWRRDNAMVETTSVTATIMDSSLEYRDSYIISQLNTTDDGVMYV